MNKIIINLTLCLVIVLITGCEIKKESKKETKTFKVTENEVIKERKVEGMKITNISINVTNGVSKLTFDVTNNTDKDYSLDQYQVIFKDKNGGLIAQLPGYVGGTIKAGETKKLNSSIDLDLSKAKSAEIKVVK